MDFFKRLFKSNNSSTNDISGEIKKQEHVVENTITNNEEEPKSSSPENVLTFDERRRLIEKLVKGEETITDSNTSDLDPLFEDAARLIVQSQIASTSHIQRRMKLGYNRAGRLMDQLERIGIVGPNLGSAAREIKLKSEMELEQFIQSSLKIHKVDLNSFYEENKSEIEEKKLAYQKQKQEEYLKHKKEIIRQELLEKDQKKTTGKRSS